MNNELLKRFEQFKPGGQYGPMVTKWWTRVLGFIDRYSIIVSGVVIYIYFLLGSINIFRSRESSRDWLDFILQFDSLIFLWLIAVVTIQLQKYKQKNREHEEYTNRTQYEFDRQRTKLQVVEEITSLLQDSINNPLAIISLNSQKLRRKMEGDPEAADLIDRIDNGLQRVHTTINDIKAYQTQKIAHEAMSAVNGKPIVAENVMERIASLADASRKLSEGVTNTL
jgi:signal transduction histidine kinase